MFKKTTQNGLGFERIPATLFHRLRSQNMTREVAKICEKRAPGINRIIIKYMQHYIVIRLKQSMMFVPFRRGCCCCCCCFFFFARVSLFIKATQCPRYICLRKSKFSFYHSKFQVVGKKTKYLITSDKALIVWLWRPTYHLHMHNTPKPTTLICSNLKFQSNINTYRSITLKRVKQ